MCSAPLCCFLPFQDSRWKVLQQNTQASKGGPGAGGSGSGSGPQMSRLSPEPGPCGAGRSCPGGPAGTSVSTFMKRRSRRGDLPPWGGGRPGCRPGRLPLLPRSTSHSPACGVVVMAMAVSRRQEARLFRGVSRTRTDGGSR